MRKFFSSLVVLVASVGIAIGFSSPAHAAWSGSVVRSCQVDAAHWLYGEQYAEVNLFGGNVTRFGNMIIRARNGSSTKASVRTSSGQIVAGPISFSGNADSSYNWGVNVTTNLDPRVRIFYYYGVGCSVTLNPPNN